MPGIENVRQKAAEAHFRPMSKEQGLSPKSFPLPFSAPPADPSARKKTRCPQDIASFRQGFFFIKSPALPKH